MNLEINKNTDIESLVNNVANVLMIKMLTQIEEELKSLNKDESLSVHLDVKINFDKIKK